MADTVPTSEALRLAGIEAGTFINLVNRGQYTAAPKTSQGVVRQFDRDDVLALSVLKTLTGMGVVTPMAAYLASQLRETLRRSERIGTLHIVVTPDRKGAPVAAVVDDLPDGPVLLSIPLPIRKWRIEWAAQLRTLIADRAAT